MSILDRILGRRSDSAGGITQRPIPGPQPTEPLTNEQAVERYRYLLRTAPPDAIEQAHTEAFAQLTPAQRRLLLESLNGDLPAQERADRDDPQSLARLATRAELRRPGTLERTFGGVNSYGPTGGLLASNFLSTIAAVVVGSAIADAIFADGSYDEGYQDGADAAGTDPSSADADSGYDPVDPGYDTSGDLGGDIGGGDF